MTINSHALSSASPGIKVTLVDNVLLSQECLALVLQNSDQNLIVSVVSHAREIDNTPDVIVVNGKYNDLSDKDIISEATFINETWPTVPRLIILERAMPANTALEALRMGWHGYFPANERLELLVMAIRIVQMGGIFVPSEVRQFLQTEDII